MIIRTARDSEVNEIRKLAEEYNFDTKVMPANEFLVAEEAGKIIGFARSINHPDCIEFSSILTIPEKRGQGIGKQLMQARLKDALKEGKGIYLATINPAFSEKLGFKKVSDTPKSMIKDKSWCEGCPAPDKCTIMKYEHS